MSDVERTEPGPIPITRDMLEPPAPDPRAGRIDFERGMTYAPPLTLTLLTFLAGVFIRQMALGELATPEAVIASGALVRERVLAGEWWRMLTATALHGSVEHLVGNGVSLYTLGIACERAFGGRRFTAIYLLSGLGGSALSMLVSPGPSVGASGAIFGVMGALIAYLIKYQDRFYVRDKRIGIVLLVWACFTLVQGITSPYIDNGAHLGGLMVGILAGLFVPSEQLEQAATRKVLPPARG